MEAPPPIFAYNGPSSDHQESPPEKPLSGSLEIHVHHARNIHNICIYDNQDVYAKFSLTSDPDDATSTGVAAGGGKNPEFNETLIIKIHRKTNPVLKCEIWMLSRAKNYLDDQLLGFSLVPIASVLGKGKVTQDFSLSSTDLFHSPAGTIRLSLSLNPNAPSMGSAPLHYSASDEFSSDETKNAAAAAAAVIREDYSRIEFPDLRTASESQKMVSELFAKNEGFLIRTTTWLEGPMVGSFLRLGSLGPNNNIEDCEMLGSSWDDLCSGDGGSSKSVQNSGLLSSTMTSLGGDDRNSADSKERRSETLAENEAVISREDAMSVKQKQQMIIQGDDESAMQKQIVDMYVRSMQQFTESLEKMKLPMDLGKKKKENYKGSDEGEEDSGILIRKDNLEVSDKDNSRVFYGSRAFF